MERSDGQGADDHSEYLGPGADHVEAADVREIFIPEQHQWDLSERLERFNVLVCHRGFGKTVLAVNELLRFGVDHAGTDYAYVAPFRTQAKDIAWDKVLKPYGALIPGATFNESELRCTLPNESSAQLFGGENAHRLRGMHLSGVVLDEFAQMRPNLWKEIIFPALQRRHGFAIFIGTPLGKNHFYDLYQWAQHQPDWYADTWPASRSNVFTLEQLEEFRRTQGPDLYAQEYECSWEAAIHGAYYARQIEEARQAGRVRHIPWEPAVPVDTWWDLGWSDATAIIFGQRMGREIRLIDYLEGYGQNLAYYASQLASKGYLYGTHYLPHDAGHHELGSGKTLDEQLRMLGVKPAQVLGANEPIDGINQARLIFPRVFFDADKCSRLVDALGSYRAEWDDKRQDFKDKPLHDWTSHAADAFRYMAITLRDLKGPQPLTREPARNLGFKPYTYQKARRALGVGFRPYR